MKFQLLFFLLFLLCCSNKRNDKISRNTNGIIKTYHQNKKINTITTYRNGIKDGQSFTYDELGNLMWKVFYKNGKYGGEVIHYYRNGIMNFREKYDSTGLSNGILEVWYENGKLRQRGMNLNSKMNGKWELFYPDGKLKTIEFYKSNIEDSTWVYLLNNADTLRKEIYKKGLLIDSVLYK